MPPLASRCAGAGPTGFRRVQRAVEAGSEKAEHANCWWRRWLCEDEVQSGCEATTSRRGATRLMLPPPVSSARAHVYYLLRQTKASPSHVPTRFVSCSCAAGANKRAGKKNHCQMTPPTRSTTTTNHQDHRPHSLLASAAARGAM